jgi:hypothetical protein
MSRKIKPHYGSFNREFLATFMSEEELNELDRKYNEARVKKSIKTLERISGLKIDLKEIK